MTTQNNNPHNIELRPDLWDGRLSARDREVLTSIAYQYGLDPLTGEVMMLRGKVYITATGLQKLAVRDPSYAGCEVEIVQADWEKNFYVIKAKVWKKGCDHPFEDFGDADPSTSSLRGKALFRHAITRARARAMRSAFAVPFVSIEEMGEEEKMREAATKQGGQHNAPVPREQNPHSKPSQGGQHRSPAPRPPAPQEEEGDSGLYTTWKKSLEGAEDRAALHEAWNIVRDSREMLQGDELERLAVIKDKRKQAFEEGEA